MKIIPGRWYICGLLFFATTLNYIDRQILGVLAPILEKEIGWNEAEYGFIVTAFQAAYALGFIVAGRLIDLVGTRLGLSIAVGIWSIAAISHAWARSAFQFALARFALGLGEAGNFPCSLKAVAEWFPKEQRALATGIFNSGTNVGAILTPLLIPWIAITWGWKAAFILSGSLGLIWLLAWIVFFRTHSAPVPIYNSSPKLEPFWKSWLVLSKNPAVWAFALGKFMTDPVWWFYLFWVPKFLYKEHQLSITAIGLPLICIYLLADLGSIMGGWASSHLVKRGLAVHQARQRVMLVSAFLVLPVILVPFYPNLWLVVLLLGLAAAAHQSWSANLFTSVADKFPAEQVATVIGMGGMLGAIGGMLVATATGLILHYTGSYVLLFSICGVMYLLAFLVFKYLFNNDLTSKEIVY